MLDIKKEMDESRLVVAVEGRLDTLTAPELETVLKASMDGAASLVLDFKGLEYISSAGLRVLLTAQKVMSAKEGMKVTNVSDEVNEIFEVTGFSDILTIE